MLHDLFSVQAFSGLHGLCVQKPGQTDHVLLSTLFPDTDPTHVSVS